MTIFSDHGSLVGCEVPSAPGWMRDTFSAGFSDGYALFSDGGTTGQLARFEIRKACSCAPATHLPITEPSRSEATTENSSLESR
jgi:hypothetical protein